MAEIEEKVRAHYHLGEESSEKAAADDLKLTAKNKTDAADKTEKEK